MVNDDGEIESAIDSLIKIKSSGNNSMMFIHMIDNSELVLDYNGYYNFKGLEKNIDFIVDSSKIRNEYSEIMRKYMELIEKKMFSSGIKYIKMNTSTSIEKNILQLFGGNV